MKCRTLKKLTAPDGYTVATCEPTPSPGQTLLFAFDQKNVPAAVLLLEPRAAGLVVASVQVKDARAYGKRLGTRLYEAAVEHACKLGKPLVSDHERSPFAEAFWRKQVGKGRANCLPEKGKGKFYANPAGPALDREVGPERAAELRKNLPQPATDGTYEWWPCRRYGVTTPCEVQSLEGVRRRAKKRRR